MTTNELIDLTKKLIAIPSTNDNPESLKEAVNFLARHVAQNPAVTIEGYERNGKHSFIAYRGHTRPKKFDVLLNAHVDIVPADPEQFAPYEKDGRLYGRGALDMKGTAMILTDVFREMVDKVPYKLGLEIVSDEEIGGYDGARMHIDEGLRASFVIVGEYANHRNTIYNAARGLCWAEIAFHGKEAHGGHPWKGDSAVIKAGKFAGAIVERYPTPDKETWTTTANISSLTTPNETHNKVPDLAVLKIDFRFTQEDPVFENEDTVRAFIASIDPEAELVKMAAFEPAVNVEELNPYVQGLGRAVKQITKAEPQFLGRPASSDGRHFAMFNNDIVEFGLYGQNSHTKGEYAELSSFDEYRSIVRSFLKSPNSEQLKTKEPTESLHITLLRQLISMPTITGDFNTNNNALNYIGSFLHERGMYIEEFEREQFRSIVATTRPDTKESAVMLVAHIDVVPGDIDQFKMRIQGDKILGRGVMDMKFSIAAYMALVDAMRGELADFDFGIMITSDEEVGSNNGVSRLVKEYGYKPKVAIVPDGGEDWRLETFSKGTQWVELTARGRNGHASRPWEGDSAINRLLSAIKEIQKLMPDDPRPEDTFMSVGTIEGGTTANQIPTNASAMLDIRYGSVHEFMSFPVAIIKAAEKHGVHMHIAAEAAPTTTDPADFYVKPFVDIVSRITGHKHKDSFSFGMTDARYFNAVGIPSVVMEPPSGNRHKDGEWLSKTGFDQYVVILEEYVRRMADMKVDRRAAKDRDVARLAKRLNSADKPAYVWYATFGSGLSRQNFNCLITGGRPPEADHDCRGCRDKHLPLKNTFLSLPYDLYFAGESSIWGGGGLATLGTTLNKKAHTIARAYLITVEQLEDIAAQENMQTAPIRLPLAMAIRDGHVTIKNVTGKRLYDELMYCRLEGGVPVFTLTSLRKQDEHTLPSGLYTKLLCKGLSQNPDLDTKAAIDYLTSNMLPGYFKKQTISKIFEDLDMIE